MGINVCCKQADGYGNCNKKPKRFGFFKRSCPEYASSEFCDIAERYPKPLGPISYNPKRGHDEKD